MDWIRRFWFTAPLITSALGCTLALDIESLNDGRDSDTTPPLPTPECNADPQCDDGVDCTDDRCIDGTCTQLPVNDSCGYLEYCDPTQGCLSTGDECGSATDCDDSVGCTVEDCVYGQCQHSLNDDICDNPNPCIIEEVCLPDDPLSDPTTGCSPGREKICDPSTEPCAIAICDVLTGECIDQLIAGADDDKDGFLDNICGGDDCNDEDINTNPSAAEQCNLKDNNCDGFLDLVAHYSSTIVREGFDLGAAEIVFNGTHFALAWHEKLGATSSVFIQLLDLKGNPITAATVFTGEVSDAVEGELPTLTHNGNTFYAAWVSKRSGNLVNAAISSFAYNETNQTIQFLQPATIVANTLNAPILSPTIVWVPDIENWAAAWIYSTTSGEQSIWIQTGAEQYTSGTLVSGSWILASVQLGVVGTAPHQLIAAYDRADLLAVDQFDVYEAQFGWIGGDLVTADGYPKLVSPAGAYTSQQPALDSKDESSWITLYDYASAADANSDIWGDLGSGPQPIVAHTSVTQNIISLVQTNPSSAILFRQDVGSHQALDFRWLDHPMDTQGGRLYLSNNKRIHSAKMIQTADDRFAAVWITHIGADQPDQLSFLSFSGCRY